MNLSKKNENENKDTSELRSEFGRPFGPFKPQSFALSLAAPSGRPKNEKHEDKKTVAKQILMKTSFYFLINFWMF
jgi:hypothetical protein